MANRLHLIIWWFLIACACSDEPQESTPPQGDHSTSGDANGDANSCLIASEAVSATPVDVIIAMDQSASMADEIQGVRDHLESNFTTPIAAVGVDYQVIFVSGASDLPTGEAFFQAPASINSSDALTYLLWSYGGEGKEPNTCNRVANAALQWGNRLRAAAHKVFIVLSDDDPTSFDCTYASAACTSNCAGCANDCEGWCPFHQCPTYADQPAAWGGGTFPAELYALEPAGMFGTPAAPRWVMHAIVGVHQEFGPEAAVTPLNQVCNVSGNTAETSGVEYQKLAVLTGGMRFPSCDTNLAPVFGAIATTVVPLACTFDLDALSIEDLDRVNVLLDLGSGDQTIERDTTMPCDGGAEGWQYVPNRNSIILCGPACSEVQANAGAQVTVTTGCDTVER